MAKGKKRGRGRGRITFSDQPLSPAAATKKSAVAAEPAVADDETPPGISCNLTITHDRSYHAVHGTKQTTMQRPALEEGQNLAETWGAGCAAASSLTPMYHPLETHMGQGPDLAQACPTAVAARRQQRAAPTQTRVGVQHGVLNSNPEVGNIGIYLGNWGVADGRSRGRLGKLDDVSELWRDRCLSEGARANDF